MASHFEDEDPTIKECANCGSMENLARCSRCHTAWFCSVKCQRSYWPFHKEWCKKNDFADMIEAEQPKFAKWMRKHGKIAVLKDDEVDRLERKVTTMESMYGRNNPKPLPPTYTPEEILRMKASEEQHMLEQMTVCKEDQLWAEIDIPADMGLECSRYKWRQNQSHVNIYVQLPHGTSARAVMVDLQPNYLSVTVGTDVLFKGDLYAPVKLEDSTWLINDGILEIVLLKRYRKGFYEDGKSNSDTFWFSIFRKPNKTEALQLDHPPSKYYSSYYEKDGKPLHKRIGKNANYPMIDRSKER
mmetsp:Transcript_27506/g.52351  ORF Transcript_27506/g.52351 Transcript_27506/m.52351 type:complete len:300 (+) Transcript_27506:194-1093(+)